MNSVIEEVVLRQSGSAEAHTISFFTDVAVDEDLLPAGGEVRFTVTLGGGATGFTATRTASSSPPLVRDINISQNRGRVALLFSGMVRLLTLLGLRR